MLFRNWSDLTGLIKFLPDDMFIHVEIQYETLHNFLERSI